MQRSRQDGQGGGLRRRRARRHVRARADGRCAGLAGVAGWEQCIIANGEAKCTLGPCPATIKDGDKPVCSQSGSHKLQCDKGKLLSLDCAAFGLKCTTGADGAAACATSSPACTGNAKRCDGTTAIGCFNGHEVRVDCASAGLVCNATPGSWPVGACVQPPPPAGACDPNDKPRCDGASSASTATTASRGRTSARPWVSTAAIRRPCAARSERGWVARVRPIRRLVLLVPGLLVAGTSGCDARPAPGVEAGASAVAVVEPAVPAPDGLLAETWVQTPDATWGQGPARRERRRGAASASRRARRSARSPASTRAWRKSIDGAGAWYIVVASGAAGVAWAAALPLRGSFRADVRLDRADADGPRAPYTSHEVDGLAGADE